MAVVVLLAVLVAGCTDAGDEVPDDDGPIAVTVEVLAAAGIAVFDEPGDAAPLAEPASPVSPVRLLAWQVHALAAEADQFAGMTAAELDALFDDQLQDPAGVSAAAVISAWAEGLDTPAARHARGLLKGPADWPASLPARNRPVYSDLVLILFLSDVAVIGASLPDEPADADGDTDADGDADARTAADASAASTGSNVSIGPIAMVRAPAPAPAPVPGDADVGDACTAGIGFLHESVAAAFDALQKLITPPPVSTGFGPFDALANAVVGAVVGAGTVVIRGGQILVDDIVIGLTVGQAMQTVATISGFVGALANVTSLVKPWTVDVVAEPDPNAVVLAPAEQGNDGKVTASVRVVMDTWPTWMEACAAAAGRPLPTLRPAGYPVSWDFSTVPDGLAVVTHADGRLSGDAAANLDFRTAVQDVPDPQARLGLAQTIVYIERDDARRLAELLADLVANGTANLFPALNAIPPIAEAVRAKTRAFADQVLTKVLAELRLIRRHTQHVVHTITYYQPGEDPDGPTAPTAGPTPPDRPQDRICPFATGADAERLTGIGGLDNTMVLLPGDVREGVELTFTSCTWATAGYEWQVIAVVHRGPTTPQAYSAYREELAEEWNGGVVEVAGPWDSAFTIVAEDDSDYLAASQVFALTGDVMIEAHIISGLGENLAMQSEATALARHVYDRIGG